MTDPVGSTFLSWTLTHRKVLTSLASFLSITSLAGVVAAFKTVQSLADSQLFRPIWFGVQAVICLVLFGILYWRTQIKEDSQYPMASREVENFRFYALWLWLAWTALYATMTLREVSQEPQRRAVAAAAAAVAEAVNTVQIPIAALLAVRETLLTDVDDAQKWSKKVGRPAIQSGMANSAVRVDTLIADFLEKRKRLNDPAWALVITLLNNLQTVCFVLLFMSLAFPTRPDRGLFAVAAFLVVTALPWILQLLLKSPVSLIDLVSGLAAGTALAMVVGRLDSKFLQTPLLVTAPLYLYALIQMTWPAYGDSDTKFIIASGAALLLKVVVFFVVSWLLSSGSLLYYFMELRWLFGTESAVDYVAKQDTVEARRQRFFAGLRPARDEFRKKCELALRATLEKSSLTPWNPEGGPEFDLLFNLDGDRAIAADCLHWRGENLKDPLAALAKRANELRRTSRKAVSAVCFTSPGFGDKAWEAAKAHPSVGVALVSDRSGALDGSFTPSFLNLEHAGQAEGSVPDDSPAQVLYAERQEAYLDLQNRLDADGVQQLNLLQFTGFEAKGLVESALKRGAKVRLLLASQTIVDQYRGELEHATRRQAALDHFKAVLHPSLANKLEIREYNSTPGLCVVVADNRVACVSWYRTWHDCNRATIIRGHDSLAVTSSDPRMLDFANRHFENLWGV